MHGFGLAVLLVGEKESLGLGTCTCIYVGPVSHTMRLLSSSDSFNKALHYLATLTLPPARGFPRLWAEELAALARPGRWSIIEFCWRGLFKRLASQFPFHCAYGIMP